MLRLRDVRRAVEALGGTLEQDNGGRYTVYQACAPDRMVWAGTTVHCMRIEWMTGESAERQAAFADALDRMSYGLEPCDGTGGCECYPE